MTVRDLLRLALMDLQVLAAGEAIDAAEADDALTILNSLLESWSLDSLWIYTIDRVVQSLTPAQSAYTIGTGGNFPMARPDQIDRILWLDGAGYERVMQRLTVHGYQDIRLKDTSSTIPTAWYYEPSYPLATLRLWPVPTLANQIALYVWHRTAAFASLDTAIALPPGYERALRANVALELAPAFSATPHALLPAIAQESKALLARENLRIEPMELPLDIPMRGYWDYRTGGMH